MKYLYTKHYNYFSSGHVWMWELDSKESWALKNWCFWTVVLEKTLESPLDCKEIQPVNPKGKQSWIFIGRTDAEAETPNSLAAWCEELTGKDSDAGKDWRREEKGMTEDEMVGWHHRRNGHEFEQALGVGDGQGDLACCSPWGCKESDTTEWLNWTYDPCSLALVFVHFKIKNTSSRFYSLVLVGKDSLFVPWADRITSRILSCTALEMVMRLSYVCGGVCGWWAYYKGFWWVWILSGSLVHWITFSTMFSRVVLGQGFASGSTVGLLEWAYYQVHGQVGVLPASWKTSCLGHWIDLQIGWSGLGQWQKGTGAKPQGCFRFHSQDWGL